jgi:FtsZ-binding cell division protein ZapB
MHAAWPYYHVIFMLLAPVTCSVFHIYRQREMDVLKKKLEQKCQKLETVEATKENLERECEQLKNEQVVRAVQKSI